VVFSVGSVPRLYHEEQRHMPVSLKESKEVKSSESAVSSWETDPSEVVASGRPWWRRGRRRSPIVVSRCVADTHQPAKAEAAEHGN
jgi:hypothetical protein